MKYIPRWMEIILAEALKSHPVIILTGPRQVGKSTLLEQANFLKDWRYLTLDDPDVLEQAREDPKGLLWEDKPTIIDEAQRCPELLVTVKYLVDKSQRHRNFILSGSGNISLRHSPRETLAGRAIGIEVKSSKQITFGDTWPMREFLKAHPEAGKGIIVYAGNKIYPVATNIYAVPWTAF